jgi:hypothetical protein
MKWGPMLLVSFISILIFLFEWFNLRNHSTGKEKAVITILTFAGWILAVLLIVYPEMPGPTELVEPIFHPISKFLE